MSNARQREPVRIGVVGAGVMSRVHSLALLTAGCLFEDLPVTPRLVAIADKDRGLACAVADRFSYERVEDGWQELVAGDDIDLVCVCVPPHLTRDVVVAAAGAGTHVFCEKPLADSLPAALEMLDACQAAGVRTAVGTGFRWAPAMVAIQGLVARGAIGEIWEFRGAYDLDYAADPSVPLLWRFRSELAGGGAAADTGYHLIDCARFLVGEIRELSASTGRFIDHRPLPSVDLLGAAQTASATMGDVDVEDTASAIVSFANGAQGVLSTSRVATGRANGLRLEIFGSKGAVEWNFERIDEFGLCLNDDPEVRGFRRVLVNQSHAIPGELLVGVGAATGIGWLGQQSLMWREILSAVAEDRPARPSFEDGVNAMAVLDAWYAAARDGARTTVADVTGIAQG